MSKPACTGRVVNGSTGRPDGSTETVVLMPRSSNDHRGMAFASFPTMSGTLLQLIALAHRHGRFVFDLRGNCRVLTGVVVAMHTKEDVPMEAAGVIAAALQEDGMIIVSLTGVTDKIVLQRCRLFTAAEQAIRFAHVHGQTVIHNLNRSCDMHVPLRDHTDPFVRL